MNDDYYEDDNGDSPNVGVTILRAAIVGTFGAAVIWLAFWGA